jgi:hypothetical protein
MSKRGQLHPQDATDAIGALGAALSQARVGLALDNLVGQLKEPLLCVDVQSDFVAWLPLLCVAHVEAVGPDVRATIAYTAKRECLRSAASECMFDAQQHAVQCRAARCTRDAAQAVLLHPLQGCT